jgi:hypothetical protein
MLKGQWREILFLCVCVGAGEAAVGERAEPGGGVREAGAGGGARGSLHLTRHHHHRARGLHRGRPQGQRPFSASAVNFVSVRISDPL